MTAAWSVLRCVTIIKFEEFMPPMFGFVVCPIFAAIYGSILRGIKIFIFTWFRFLSKLEFRVREHLKKSWEA